MITMARKILKLLLGVVAAIIMLVVLLVAFVATPPGKSTVARIVEGQAERFVNGRLEIGEISGSILRNLTISDVKLSDPKGREIARIANLVSDHRIDLSQLTRPRLIIEKIQIEQPKIRETNWKKLLKQSADGQEDKEETAKSRGDERPAVWIKRVRVVEGAYATVAPINVDLTLPENFEQLPEGRIFAGGSYRGLPVKLAATITRENLAPGALSAVAKTADAPLYRQTVAVVGGLGHSKLEASARGMFKLQNWAESDARIEVGEFKLIGSEARRALPSLPKHNLAAKAFVDLVEREASFGAEAHFERSGKLVVEGLAENVDELKALSLKQLRFEGKCPLLTLQKPTTLSFVEGDPAPRGALELKGCAGGLTYNHKAKGVRIDARGIEPTKFLQALSIKPAAPKLQGDLGTVEFFVNLREGALNQTGYAQFGWVPRNGLAATGLQAELKDNKLGALLTVALGEEKIEARAEAKRILVPGHWKPSLDSADVNLRVNATRFPLERLKETGLVETNLKGYLSANVIAAGTRSQARAHFELNAQELGTDTMGAKLNVRANGDYDSKKLTLSTEALAVGGPSRLKANAEMVASQAALLRDAKQVIETAPIRWQIEATEFDLTRLLSRADYQALDQPSLRANVKGKGEGTMASPSAELEVHLLTTAGKLADLDARLQDHQIEGKLVAAGTNVDPALGAFTNQVRTENGKLNADFRFHGPVTHPTYEGFVRLEAERLLLPLLGGRYDELKAELQGDAEQISLRNLSAKGGDGTLKASGVMKMTGKNFAEPKNLDFKANFDRFEALKGEKMELEATGIFVLAATREDSSFKGTLEISEGKINLPETKGKKNVESLEELEDVVMVEKKKATQTADTNIFDDLHGRIHVNMPGQFWVKSSDMSVELMASLDAGLDEESEPFLEGRVRTKRGFVDAFGRRFEVRPSIVRFDGNPEEPRIEAEAYYKAAPYSIIIGVAGDPKDMKPSFESDPAGLSEEQCINVLLTGSPDYQKQGSGGAPPVRGVISGMLAGLAKDKLGPLLPFDTLTADIASESNSGSVSSDASSRYRNEEEGRSRIEVGKYISDKIFIKLGRIFAGGQDPINRLMVDYQLSNRWSILTTQTDQGRSDLEVLWSLNY